MGLLRKNLILAGIASVAMVGLLGSSGASALDGFSFSDIINRQQEQRGQLLSYLTNPFGMSTGCEAANPDSSVSCNTTEEPIIAYSHNTRLEDPWGYDGHGVVFADSDNLIDGDRQRKNAKRGDTLNFSSKFTTRNTVEVPASELPSESWHTIDTSASSSRAVLAYEFAGFLSEGLSLDENSIQIKVNGEKIPEEDYMVAFMPENNQASFIYPSEFHVLVLVSGHEDESHHQPGYFPGDPRYPDFSEVEISYSATVNADAPANVFSTSAVTQAYSYVVLEKGGDYMPIYKTGYIPENLGKTVFPSRRAVAHLDGNIVIKRVDADGNPVAGAKYKVDGIKATAVSEERNEYVYDPNGSVDEFVTNESGIITILDVPVGDYTAREVFAPEGYNPLEETIIHNTGDNLTAITVGDNKYYMDDRGQQIDLTNYIFNMDEEMMVLDLSGIPSMASGSKIQLPYDSSVGKYGFDGMYVAKTDNGYRLEAQMGGSGGVLMKDFAWDNTLQKPVIILNSEDIGETGSGYELEINGDEARYYYSNSNHTISHALSFDDSTGCYYGHEGVNPPSVMTLCQKDNVYYLQHGDGGDIEAYEYDSALQKYVYSNLPTAVFAIEESSDQSVSLMAYYVVDYVERLDTYFVGRNAISSGKKNISATEFLFREKPDDDVVPEELVNPQTSDVVIKVLAISATALLPALAIRKHFSRR